MDFLRRFSQVPNEWLRSAGKRSYLEYFVNQLEPSDRPTAKKYFQELYELEVAANPTIYFQKLQEFNGFIQEAATRNSPNKVDKTYMFRGNPTFFGYRVQGSKIWNYFPNPFGVFSYFAEQYWAVGRCIDLVRETIEADGFALKAGPNVTDEQLNEYYKKLISLDIEKLWVEQPIHMMVFGNFFALPHYGSKSRGLVKYEILYPPRLTPLFNRNTERIDGYEYVMGRLMRRYLTNEVDHEAGPSLFGKALGTPPLLSCVTELETALMTMTFNNNVMQKGGLLGKIVALEPPKDSGDAVSAGVNSQWVKEVQAQLDYIYSGTKAAQGVAAISGVKGVHEITKQGEVELNFRESRDGLDKRVCNRLGIPSEKLGIPRSTTAQYQPSLVENVVNAQFDGTVNSYTFKAARFFNEYLLRQHLGIHDAKLVPAGRYGAITLAAAQTIKELAAGGPTTTVNEARVKVLGWEPLPANDPRGNIVLDNSINRDVESVAAMIAPEAVDPYLEAEKAVGSQIDKIQTKYIKFGGEGAGQIFYGTPGKIRKEFS
jgi:hypothetical protein